MALGRSNETSVVHTVEGGKIHSEAHVVASDDQTWLWAVKHRDESGRVCGTPQVKIAANGKRDAVRTAALEASGWTVLRFVHRASS